MASGSNEKQTVDPAVSAAAAAMGRRTSPAKRAAILQNGMGNKSKLGQTLPQETRDKIRDKALARSAERRAREAAAKGSEGDKDADNDA